MLTSIGLFLCPKPHHWQATQLIQITTKNAKKALINLSTKTVDNSVENNGVLDPKAYCKRLYDNLITF